jgi:tRNA(fMet)-specific endonuclease VapC
MLVLDTDHFSELDRGSRIGTALQARLIESGEPVFISIITADESLSGWQSRIRANLGRGELLKAYHDFQDGLDNITGWNILPWTEDAADIFDRLRSQRIRVGTMDLRIGSTALSLRATLLTRNLADFRQVPELRVENWLNP